MDGLNLSINSTKQFWFPFTPM